MVFVSGGVTGSSIYYWQLSRGNYYGDIYYPLGNVLFGLVNEVASIGEVITIRVIIPGTYHCIIYCSKIYYWVRNYFTVFNILVIIVVV